MALLLRHPQPVAEVRQDIEETSTPVNSGHTAPILYVVLAAALIGWYVWPNSTENHTSLPSSPTALKEDTPEQKKAVEDAYRKAMAAPAFHGPNSTVASSSQRSALKREQPESTESKSNLYYGMMSNWYAAPRSQRIVLTKNIAASILKLSESEELDQSAAELEACLSRGTRASDVRNEVATAKITDMAALCAALMGWGRPAP